MYVPPLDNLIGSKGQRLASLVAAVELGSIDQSSGIVAATRRIDSRALSFGDRSDLLVQETSGGLDHAIFQLLGFQILDTRGGCTSKSYRNNGKKKKQDTNHL